MICEAPGCRRPTKHRAGKSLGVWYCGKHLWRVQKYGDATVKHKTGPKPLPRQKVHKPRKRTLIADAAREHGIDRMLLWNRLKRGWPMEKALSLPVGVFLKPGSPLTKHGHFSGRSYTYGAQNPDDFLPKLPWEK